MRLFHIATIFSCYICTRICCLKLHQADYQVGEVFFTSILMGSLSSNVFTICAVYWSLGRRGYFGVSNVVLVSSTLDLKWYGVLTCGWAHGVTSSRLWIMTCLSFNLPTPWHNSGYSVSIISLEKSVLALSTDITSYPILNTPNANALCCPSKGIPFPLMTLNLAWVFLQPTLTSHSNVPITGSGSSWPYAHNKSLDFLDSQFMFWLFNASHVF